MTIAERQQARSALQKKIRRLNALGVAAVPHRSPDRLSGTDQLSGLVLVDPDVVLGLLEAKAGDS